MKQENTNYICAVTSTTQEAAEHIAKTIVDEKLAAGAQILGPVTSFYWWKGEVQKDTEAFLLIRTKKECITHIKQIIEEIHPYEIPELLFLPIIDGSHEYFNWIDGIINNRKHK